MNKQIIQFFIFLFVVYLLLIGFLYTNQANMLYHPTPQIFEECSEFLDYQIIQHNTARAYYLNNSNETIIIYYRGNAGSACQRAQLRTFFEQFNTSILFLEYSGFSNDDVKPSKEKILQNVEDINEFIELQNYSNIIVVGMSIGSAPASFHSSINSNVSTVILLNPISSLQEIAQQQFFFVPIFPFLLTENFNNYRYLEKYTNTLHIIHAQKDRTINPKFSKKLYETLNLENSTYTLIEGFGHNTLWQSEEFTEILIEKIEEEWN
ncbi:MAG: hypothetical protein LAT82_01810 [Nanoarchaeota archaeon]|nr:hypothetical protein [Nanoarchaeota archaeon]